MSGRGIVLLAGFALALGGCAGGDLPGSADAPPAPQATMAGRWMLAAPNAPMCGMAFTQPAAAESGNVSPEGGCPGHFFTSRRWDFEGGKLVILDDNNEALAQLAYVDGNFQGQSTTGMPVSLSRPATQAQQ
jgi:hypothetical protein